MTYCIMYALLLYRGEATFIPSVVINDNLVSVDREKVTIHTVHPVIILLLFSQISCYYSYINVHVLLFAPVHKCTL